MNFKKWVKSIQTAGYNGARTVLNLCGTKLVSIDTQTTTWLDIWGSKFQFQLKLIFSIIVSIILWSFRSSATFLPSKQAPQSVSSMQQLPVLTRNLPIQLEGQLKRPSKRPNWKPGSKGWLALRPMRYAQNWRTPTSGSPTGQDDRPQWVTMTSKANATNTRMSPWKRPA